MSLNHRRDTGPVIKNPFFLALLVLLALGASSCTPDNLQGRVLLSGSATAAPLMSKAVEQWKRLHPRVEARVDAIGSDAGLERLIRYQEADLALVSRPLTAQDREAARVSGRDLVTLPLAWDAVCLVVPVSNTWALSLSREQATQALTSARLWSDLDPTWPAVPIHRFILGPNSGTTDVLAQALLGGSKQVLFTPGTSQVSEDDQIVARGVAQVEGALGFLGWTTYQAAGPGLRVLGLEGVEPTSDSIRTGAYALPRQLWLVGDRATLSDDPAAASLVAFLYEHYSPLIEGTGLIPLSEDERKPTL